MKRFFLLSLLISATLQAVMFQSVPPSKAKLLQSGKEARYCSNCGMDLVMFYKTSHAAKVDGKQKEFCSLHCLAEVILDGRKVSHIRVVDTKSLIWIDAKSAYYVVGSRIRGTMSKISKYAFKNISDAKEFQHLHGGKILSFQEALTVAKQDFHKR